MSNYLRKLFYIIIIINIFVFCSDKDDTEIFVKTPKKFNKTIGQLKQDIADNLITILNQSCKTIEYLAKEQQEICRIIAQIANNEKNNKLNQSNKGDLESVLEKLNEIKNNNEKYINNTIEFLKLTHSDLINKTAK